MSGELRFALLGSGSSGNATLVETDRIRLLIDAGLSARETDRRLRALGRSIEQIDVVLLTHEHDDHARGLETLSRQVRLTVVTTAGAARAVRHLLAPRSEVQVVRRGGAVRLADLQVHAFPVPHDAREPVGWRLERDRSCLGYVTDLGTVDDQVAESLSGATHLIAESNHDLDMLRQGPYPARLKKRILGPWGHLSNEALAELLRRTDLGRLQVLYLAHLSRTNNLPELAEASAALALNECAPAAAIRVAAHDRPTEVIATGEPPRPPAAEQLRLRFDG